MLKSDKLIKKLGLIDIPYLTLLDEVISQQKYKLSDEAKQEIVLTFGRCIKKIIEMSKENENGGSAEDQGNIEPEA